MQVQLEEPGDMITVSLRCGIDITLCWRTAERDYRVTVLQRPSAQHVELPRHFEDEYLARQHARGLVVSYRATGEHIKTTVTRARTAACAA